MNPARQEYLEAMDIPVWVPRDQAGPRAAAARLRLGPGDSPNLLICETTAFSSSLMAADILRSLAEGAVWAWPDEAGDDGLRVEEAVTEKVTAAVVVFGAALAQRLFGGPAPGKVGGARLYVAPDPAELAATGRCRRALWRGLLEQGLARRA